MEYVAYVHLNLVEGGAFLDAVPVWWSADADVALLALTTPCSDRGSNVPPITWANVPESKSIDVTAVGFPEADTKNDIRESRQITGHLNPPQARYNNGSNGFH